MAGSWILLVPAARRLELGLYTLRLAIHSVWKLGLKRGWYKYRPSLRVVPFTLGMVIMTAIKRRDPEALSGWVGKTIKWLDQDAEGSIRSVASGKGAT